MHSLRAENTESNDETQPDQIPGLLMPGRTDGKLSFDHPSLQELHDEH